MEEDRKYIEAVLAGSQEAFEPLVEKYQRSVFFTALRFLKNQEEADDITQKAFLRAYQALGSFRFESSFKTWLTTIAVNLCKNVVRGQRIMVEVPETLSDGSVERRKEEEETGDRKSQLKKALENLPERQKEVVMLRIYEEMPFKKIAEVLESTETAVKVNFHHAMKSLKEWIQ